jgi:hypothetical protein
MAMSLFECHTSETLLQHGLAAPKAAGAWFNPNSDETAPALFVTPDAAQCWCKPPTSDRNLCFFFSPSRLRFGVDRCMNKEDLLNFHAETYDLPNVQGRIHLFAAVVQDQWWYLGQPVLGSGFGILDAFNQVTVNQFEIGLEQRLPERLWLQFGGHRGWLVCTGRDQFVLHGAHEADYLLTEYWGTISQTMEITRYEEGTLFAATDAKKAAVLYFHQGSTHLHTGVSGPQAGDEGFYGFGDFEFARHWVVPRQQAIELIRHYLDTGSLAGLIEG